MTILLIFFIGCTVKFSSIDGQVLDLETGAPLDNAYIIAFVSLIPANQLLNPGGPNSYPDSVQIAKTDSQGFFSLAEYAKQHKGAQHPREILIYKSGYYALRYFQNNRSLTDKAYSTDSKKIPLKQMNTFSLSKHSDEPNEVIYISGNLNIFASEFKDNAPNKYYKLKPVLIEIYTMFSKDSQYIKQSLKEEHIIHNWEMDMRELKSYVELQ